MTHHILMKVAVVSKNTNSFGLRGHVLVSRTGIAIEVGLNSINEVAKGSIVRVPVTRHAIRTAESFAGAVASKLHGEIPRVRPRAPKEILDEVWK